MFEYQSLIAELTGMDIANCSLYDGFTALSEAALMCARITHKKTFLIPENISWEKKSILKNYSRGPGLIIKEIPYNSKTGKINISELEKLLNDNIAGVYIETPNFFGIFEDDLAKISDMVKKIKALLVVGVDPISLGVVKNPGFYGADIVIGEGRSFGNKMDFGGSSLGIFACKKDFLRQIPGRLIGMTTDINGNRAFCMTLQTREQHIRRGRATSNICTNEGLCALAAVVYLSWLGGNGIEDLAKINFSNGQKLRGEIESLNGYKRMFSGCHFNEFLIKIPKDPNIVNKKLLENNIHGGLIVQRWYPKLKNCLLFGITEMHNDEDINRIISVLKEI
jgi:glycine dehydrogenase subunit 1